MTAREFFQSGQLDEAIAAAILEVKDRPGDLSNRTLLFVLLCFTGDFERARKQLAAIDAQVTLSDAPTYLNLLSGEEKRRRVLNEGQAPKFLADSPARYELYTKATGRLAEGNVADAARLLEQAEEARPEVPGTLGDTSFDDFIDADDVTRSVLELFVGNEYFWVPFEQLLSLQIAIPDPIRPRDTLWAPCQVILKEGVMQRGFTPVLYVNSHQSDEQALRLGHHSQFDDVGGGIIRGVGRKQFIVGESDSTPLELKEVVFD